MSDERHERDQEEPRVRVTDRRINFDEPGAAGESPSTPAASTGDAGPAPSTGAARSTGPSEVEQLRAIADERLDQLKRAQADFLNFKQRMLREQTEIVERAAHRLVEHLLPVVDNFERALSAARGHGDDNIVKGIEMVLRQFHDVLQAEGVERLEPHGDEFDPAEHEALSARPGDVSEPTVLEVVRPGYRLKGKMLRPAQVHVQMPSEDEESTQQDH